MWFVKADYQLLYSHLLWWYLIVWFKRKLISLRFLFFFPSLISVLWTFITLNSTASSAKLIQQIVCKVLYSLKVVLSSGLESHWRMDFITCISRVYKCAQFTGYWVWLSIYCTGCFSFSCVKAHFLISENDLQFNSKYLRKFLLAIHFSTHSNLCTCYLKINMSCVFMYSRGIKKILIYPEGNSQPPLNNPIREKLVYLNVKQSVKSTVKSLFVKSHQKYRETQRLGTLTK